MYEKIKKHWQDQFPLSSNANFKSFVYNLSRGGSSAQMFVSSNSDMMEMVAESIPALMKAIESNGDVAENKSYFFRQAMKDYPKVNGVLQDKFGATVPYLQAWGVDSTGITAFNILPELKRREKITEDKQDLSEQESIKNESSRSDKTGKIDPSSVNIAGSVPISDGDIAEKTEGSIPVEDTAVIPVKKARGRKKDN